MYIVHFLVGMTHTVHVCLTVTLSLPFGTLQGHCPSISFASMSLLIGLFLVHPRPVPFADFNVRPCMPSRYSLAQSLNLFQAFTLLLQPWGPEQTCFGRSLACSPRKRIPARPTLHQWVERVAIPPELLPSFTARSPSRTSPQHPHHTDPLLHPPARPPHAHSSAPL